LKGGAWLVAIAVLAGATGLVGGASASTGEHVADGSFRVKSDYKATSTGGAEISLGTYSGSVVGTAVDTGTSVVRADGSFSGYGTELCDPCAIGGRTGAFIATYRYSGSGTTYSGTETFTRGFGKLAGLSGGGKFAGTVSSGAQRYAYSYRL